MNTEIKQEWVKRLRSGEYKQGTRYLRKVGQGVIPVDEYCSLGVLCDIVDPEGWSLHFEPLSHYAHRLHSGVPDEDIYSLAELTDPDAEELVRLNDDYRRSFADIADYIEGSL